MGTPYPKTGRWSRESLGDPSARAFEVFLKPSQCVNLSVISSSGSADRDRVLFTPKKMKNSQGQARARAHKEEPISRIQRARASKIIFIHVFSIRRRKLHNTAKVQTASPPLMSISPLLIHPHLRQRENPLLTSQLQRAVPNPDPSAAAPSAVSVAAAAEEEEQQT